MSLGDIASCCPPPSLSSTQQPCHPQNARHYVLATATLFLIYSQLNPHLTALPCLPRILQHLMFLFTFMRGDCRKTQAIPVRTVDDFMTSHSTKARLQEAALPLKNSKLTSWLSSGLGSPQHHNGRVRRWPSFSDKALGSLETTCTWECRQKLKGLRRLGLELEPCFWNKVDTVSPLTGLHEDLVPQQLQALAQAN